MKRTKTSVTETKEAVTDAAASGARDTLCVETKLGTLVAYPSKDPEHPGIYIDLKRKGRPYIAPISLVEYTDNDSNMETGNGCSAVIISRTWGNATAEEYTDKVPVQNIEEFFAIEE